MYTLEKRNITIDGMVPLFLGSCERDSLEMFYINAPKQYTRAQLEAIEKNLEIKRLDAACKGIELWDEDTYRVISSDISEKHITFIVGPSSFYHFLCINLAVFSDDDSLMTNRFIDNTNIEYDTYLDHRSIPYHLGVNVVAITEENLIVMSNRSKNIITDGGEGFYHISVAEGMQRPRDYHDPFEAAYRGLREELGIRLSEEARKTMVLAGIWLDTLRRNFQFVFTINLDEKFFDIEGGFERLKEKEHSGIFPLLNNRFAIATLLEDKKMHPASNNVLASIYTIMVTQP